MRKIIYFKTSSVKMLHIHVYSYSMYMHFIFLGSTMRLTSDIVKENLGAAALDR